MTLPPAQARVLRFIADAGPATIGDVSAGLRMDRTAAKNALTLLAGKDLVAADHFAVPVSYEVTGEGREALAAGDGA